MWEIFVDFDGTITDRDTFDVLVPIFAGRALWDRTERALETEGMSLREALASQASVVRGERSEIFELLRREVRVDASFAAFARNCLASGIALTVASSGVASIVRDRLSDFELNYLSVVANEVDIDSEGRWRMRFRDPGDNGTDKAALVRAAQAAGRRTVFIGDGRSDYDAAVVADIRFAKRGLALERYLEKCEIEFERFDSFAEVHARCSALGILGEPV